MSNKFIKDEKGFTGLEAAIVLIAFVVVAAVFSYVMLGAGFFTTQKSQEVVHTGVTQASSSVELSGDVIADGTPTAGATAGVINDVNMCLQLTSGGSSVDMAKTLIIYSSPTVAPMELTYNTVNATLPSDGTKFGITHKYNDNGDDILDRGEKFDIQLITTAEDINANEGFQVEIKPPQGATYTIHRTAPPSIAKIMALN
jgi:archaeal flagellin FlaB